MEQSHSSEELMIEERKKKIINLINKKKSIVYYSLLAVIVLVSLYIRTRNISRLKDITTSTWTLGPDLDPFLFLRWAKYIVTNGSLMVWDNMRYVPLGYNTAGEMKLLAYMIAWFHKVLEFLSLSNDVTYSSIIFPVFMAGFTAIAFFLFSRKVFYKENETIRNIIALLATTFFVLIPSLLPRTIAGIPEKESAAFFFMFLAFYFFLEAMTSVKIKKGIFFSVLAGVSTALMALIWGGMIFIFFAISISTLLSFILGKIQKKEFYIYLAWLLSSFALMVPFSTRYAPKILIISSSTGFAIGVLAIIGISLLIQEHGLTKRMKLPKEISAIVFSILVVFIMVLIFLGPSFVIGEVIDIKNSLISPQVTRFGMTVAENRQPYFAGEWKESFGPVLFNIPLYFWMFFIGSVLLFGNLIEKLNKKEKIILICGYLIFLFGLIFSRYSPGSLFNGINNLSLLFYFSSWIIFIGSFSYVYYQRYKSSNIGIFKELNFSYILYFMILTLGIIGARAGIRLIMVLGAISPVAIAFLVIKTSQKCLKEKEETLKFFVGVLAVILIVSSAFVLWTYYKQDKYSAENFAPGVYQWQWQKAMAWVRENTSEDAVFAHWWDYGYWVQSIGERATILDGGNTIAYWNHLMGRYVLTGADEKEALEFLYTHNGTHLLIDSTDIGKYTAFSSIGSDEEYDRFSWITTFLMDDRQTRETNNETIYVYSGGTSVDEDIIWNDSGKEIFLPKRKAVVGAIILTKNGEDFNQPKAIFIYNNRQYTIPLRYLYINGKLKNFGSGIEAGIFIFPRLDVLPDGRASINNIGASFYLSRRTVNSQLAKLYLFGQESDYFKLVHSEDNLFMENLKEQGTDAGEFLYYQGFQGPIKIWEIRYPSNIQINKEYLNKKYPKELNIAKSGEYN